MNRVIVRQTAAALARHLGAGSTFVVARDARYGSEEYADDTAQVLAAAGCQVLLLDQPVITPVLAFAVHRLEAAAGVMVTASHNPAADNGYKMYDGEGIQIVPPTDVAVQAAINEILVEGGDPPLAPPDHPAIESVPVELRGRGGRGLPRRRAAVPAHVPATVSIRAVQTSLHGVADPFIRAAFERAGFPPLEVVASQAQPDPDFPTVSFPNPEEPGALDAAFELAASSPTPTSCWPTTPTVIVWRSASPPAYGWRRLAGDETGSLLADHLLNATSGSSRMVVRTVVSSHMLDRMAEHHGVRVGGDADRDQVDSPARAGATRRAVPVRLRGGAGLCGVQRDPREGRGGRRAADGRDRGRAGGRGADDPGSLGRSGAHLRAALHRAISRSGSRAPIPRPPATS